MWACRVLLAAEVRVVEGSPSESVAEPEVVEERELGMDPRKLGPRGVCTGGECDTVCDRKSWEGGSCRRRAKISVSPLNRSASLSTHAQQSTRQEHLWRLAVKADPPFRPRRARRNNRRCLVARIAESKRVGTGERSMLPHSWGCSTSRS